MATFPFNGQDGQGNEVVEQIKDAFKRDQSFIRVDRHILFVCGGAAGTENQRARFLAFARDSLPSLRILLAEDAYGDFLAESSNRVLNLSIFERVLAQLADCILIFPESAGSFAELGFFSAYNPLVQKTLAVSPLAYQATDSFIALGPFASINRKSDFSPILFATNDNATHIDIAKRLNRLGAIKRRQHLPYQNWYAYEIKEKLFITFELIRLLRLVHSATVSQVLREIFGGYVNQRELRHIVAILVASDLLKRGGNDDRYLTAISQRAFLDIPASDELLARSNNYLLSHHGELYDAFLGSR